MTYTRLGCARGVLEHVLLLETYTHESLPALHKIRKYLVEATEEALIAYNKVVTRLIEYKESILTLILSRGNTMRLSSHKYLFVFLDLENQWQCLFPDKIEDYIPTRDEKLTTENSLCSHCKHVNKHGTVYTVLFCKYVKLK
ncbi:hypothetical protein ACFE04_017813 [Oxalis oulophora]